VARRRLVHVTPSVPRVRDHALGARRSAGLAKVLAATSLAFAADACEFASLGGQDVWVAGAVVAPA
jgi:hypothetical protein